MSTAILKTDIAWIEIGGDDAAITRLLWHSKKPAEIEPTPLLREAVRQLEAYIDGKLQNFDLPLRAEGSDVAKSVWREMLAIPYGRTRTYGDVATALQAQGDIAPTVTVPAQLVGQACGQNPIAVIIPCHRIVGASSLGGYTSELGLRAKTFLLDLERGQGSLF
jgi:methylated-DNA-[protein]-cysteine S-methyltransferase